MAPIENIELQSISAFGVSSDSSTQASRGYVSDTAQTTLSSKSLEQLDSEGTVRYDDIPEERKQIGAFTATFLVFNRIIGTGIFATPSTVLALTGSVGMSLVVWFLGMIIAMAGTAVYLEFGTAIPINGGEKNYLEYVYTRPKFLATAMYASYALLLGWAAGNSVIFGEYLLHAIGFEVNRWNQRGIGFLCITAAFAIHTTAVNWGIRVQNALGVMKLVVVLLIVVGGLLACAGFVNIERPRNFKQPWGEKPLTAYGVVTGLYNVIWSYVGYANANYCLSETRHPVRTLKIALPVGICMVGALYFLVNIAYFAAVPKEEMLASGRKLAASFFRNVFGSKAERALSVFVAFCAFGNVLAILFSQGRIIQSLGREGLLPLSSFWASNRPFNSPAAGLLEQYVVSVFIMLVPPPGDAYNFLLNLIGYPLSVINVFVSGGLIHIYFFPARYQNWYPGFRASLPVAIFFFLCNLYLVVAPFLPPPDKSDNVYDSMPYYIHCVGGIAIFGIGALYWLVWARILPWTGGYQLSEETTVGSDGWSRKVISRASTAPELGAAEHKDKNMWAWVGKWHTA
ncbi:methionine permease [Ophidiomyces ophidiicola]|nr:methionine permease [Ophidiomyces ophidiicola]